MQRNNRGFVLVSVLWVLVIMILAATAFSVWVDRVRESAVVRQQRVESYRVSVDALHKIVYTYMTGFKSAEGVAWPGEHGAAQPTINFDSLDDFMAGAAPTVTASSSGFLRMDGSVLDLGGGVRVMVQDRAGLIGLSFLSDIRVFKAIASQGGGEVSAERLRDTLRDYQDPDGIRKLQGAEQQDYLQQGMSVPANGYLRSPLQLRNVLAWNSVLAARDDAWILQVFKTEGASIINANTASHQALALVVKNLETVPQLIDKREQKRFDGVSKLTPYAGIDDEILLSILPASGVRFWWWYEGGSTAYVYDVQFSPLESGVSAWYFNWSARVNLPDELASRTAIAIDHPFFH
ncbi:MAG: hypothetical protein AAGC78_09125 [Cellvibrio sp.]|uniref:hypothetical protein n=1 Tax=Cellvibrio sp. TaxID=1965322 RepID=UPI0031AB9650